MACDRMPAQIARTIVDRLLPAYRVELAEVRRHRLAALAAHEREEQLAHELAAVAGGRFYAGQHNLFHAVAVKGRVADNHGVWLELDDLAPQTARRILELIRQVRGH